MVGKTFCAPRLRRNLAVSVSQATTSLWIRFLSSKPPTSIVLQSYRGSITETEEGASRWKWRAFKVTMELAPPTTAALTMRAS
jgi:hypothetical protein